MIKRIIFTLLATMVALYLISCTSMGSNPRGERQQTIERSAQYSSKNSRFENPQPTPLFTGKRSRWEIFIDFFFGEQQRRPEQPLPEAPPPLSSLENKSKAIRFIWFGHSTILLELDGKRILIDPIFSNYASPIPGIAKRFQAPVWKVDQIPDIDVVLISHDHYDHLDYQTISELKGRQIHYMVPLGVGAHLEYWGIEKKDITELDWWESSVFNTLHFTATPAQHFSGRGLFNENSTLWAGWVVKGGQQKVFFSGDSGYGEHYKKIGERLGPFDLAFVENGAYNLAWKFVHQLPEEGVQANIDLNSRAMVPVHWGMFDLSIHSWYEPIERVSKAAEERGVILIAPKLGQLVSTLDNYVQERWWHTLIPPQP